jgi:hypothetical protein
MHQSVQEYFTALYFRDASPEALVDFTPRLLPDIIEGYGLLEVPTQRFVPPLLIMAGLLDDTSRVVEILAQRNPILAAAAIASANRVNSLLLGRLEQSWLDLLDHDELTQRIIGCSCLVHAGVTSRRVVQRLITMAFAPDFDVSYSAELALKRLSPLDAVIPEVVDRVLNLTDEEYRDQERVIGGLVENLPSPTSRFCEADSFRIK